LGPVSSTHRGEFMHGFRSAFALGLALLTGALLAACGGTDEKNDYVDEINALQQSYQSQIGQSSVPTNLAEVRALSKKAAELDDRLAADVAAVEPPGDVEDLHAQLVTTLEESAATTADLEQVVRSTSNRRELQRAIAEADRNTEATIDEFNALIDQINEEL
jgi:hypothetical protein